MKQVLNTEERVLIAAKKIFIRKGMTGARMHEIAEEAEINKALLHYYFRSKEKLFEAVFRNTFKEFVPKIDMLLSSDLSMENKINEFVREYIDLLKNNPHLPQFVLNELNRNPDRLVDLISATGIEEINPIGMLDLMLRNAGISDVNAAHLLINILSMCIFPFVSRPILERVLLKSSEKNFDDLLEERKTEIPRFIINSIKK